MTAHAQQFGGLETRAGIRTMCTLASVRTRRRNNQRVLKRKPSVRRVTSPHTIGVMDSQVTLVDPSDLPERVASVTELVFDRDSLTNATLRVRGGHVEQFVIRTADRSMSRTELLKVEPVPGADGQRLVPVVRIDRGGVLPDTIAFGSGTAVRVKKWLKHKAFGVPCALFCFDLSAEPRL